MFSGQLNGRSKIPVKPQNKSENTTQPGDLCVIVFNLTDSPFCLFHSEFIQSSSGILPTMSSLFVKFVVGGLFLALLAPILTTPVHAQGCLGPGQQRKAINSGQAVPFGSIASRIGGELAGARLCHQGGRLIYIVTILRGSQRVDAIFDARSGKRLR